MSVQLDEMFRELKPPLTAFEAQKEASRCLECGGPYAPAPCTVACPTRIDIPGFVSAIHHGDENRAGHIVFSSNPLAGTCARVCPTPVMCEGACVLNHVGQRPVAIARLQRNAAHAVSNRAVIDLVSRRGQSRRVAIIGAGPSGLTCAAELVQHGYQVTIYDQNPEPGGLVRYAIAPYRQRVAPLPDEIEPLTRAGVQFRFNTRVAGRDAFLELEKEADAIFLGVGLGQDIELDVPGHRLFGVWQALPFIRALKSGRPPAVGRSTVVIGGGNTALDVAREAVRLGSEQVTVIYRRDRHSMPAYDYEVSEAEAEGIRFHWLASPVGFLGEAWLDAVECQYQELVPDKAGRFFPEPVPGAIFRLSADTAIMAVGQMARTELEQWISGIRFDHGRLVMDADSTRTPNPKYFAGGDAVGGVSVVEAVQWGKRAAEDIHQYLAGED